jgi:hypothetical protein
MWTITRDVLYEKEEAPDYKSEVGVFGGNCKKDREIDRWAFRMLDDDGEVYYYGVSDQGESFAPLWHFGTPNAGCTEIQYKQPDGRWETL